MTLPLIILMLLSTPALADDSLTLHMGAAATFIHSQVLQGLGVTLQLDVTDKVPHEVAGNIVIIL